MNASQYVKDATDNIWQTNRVANAHLKEKYSKEAFGVKQWNTFFGNVGEEPPLPANINEILESDCRFWPGKKVYETHMLVLIPAKVNLQDLTIDILTDLVKKPKQPGHPTEFSYMEGPVSGNPEYIYDHITKSYWILV